ncbi:Uncharacterized protein OS=Blastopirellula marina DSM 3645 GN=DSM3645_15135 PE=4 SV=1 [Gemmata massiliana]|uniref:Uncharacterized protein n=1 Tax=Gemmata massiliana TaxID=1210884 RepID=A0A6P2D3F9_9BACT|nr:Ig-like domain-containing protein [Gemmata massiliana]VTR93982.1 Uncharacterized protein OS=Blastopirellula marina DSM 3645 GN=DSM3645_15135 PE=4 SV=1 [Gemmata massiliana]
MARNAAGMLLCLGLGAAVMYGSTNYRTLLERIASETAAPATDTPNTAPAPLPPEVTAAPRAAEPVRRDPNVRPASLTDEMKPEPVKSVRLEDAQGIVWDLNKPPVDGVATLGTAVKLKLDRTIANQLLLSTDDPAVREKPVDDVPGVKRSDENGTTFVALDLTKLKANDGKINFELRVKSVGPLTSDPYKFTILVPSEPSDAISGQVTEYATSPPLRPAPISSVVGMVDVYGKPQYEPYLRLFGQVKGAATLRFVLQPEGGVATEVDGDIGRNASGAWDARVRLPVLNDLTKAKLFMRVEYTNARLYFTNPLPLRFNFVPETLDPPALDVPVSAEGKTVTPASDFSTPGLPAYYSNGTKFDLKVTPPQNAQVLVAYVDNAAIFPGISVVPAPGGDGKVTFQKIDVGNGRDHVIRVAAVRGSFVGTPAQIKLMVATTPPTVESVNAQPGFGQSNGIGTEKIVIRFSSKNPIDSNFKADTFKVSHNENKAQRGNLPIGTPAYDKLTNSVTLNVGAILPGTYTVAILKNKITDVFGNALPESTEVQDGGNAFEATVSTQAATDKAAPVDTPGTTLQTGPPVDFRIYLKPPVYDEGFNPSDRVESRVARLYYYRDAHRVAQLINRSVKSYNAADVDVRRRAANRTRDDANKAEDERKRLEFLSVKAAQDARAAEAELNNLQNRVAGARGTAEQARRSLIQKRIEIDEAKRMGRPPGEIAGLQAEAETIERALISADSIDRQGPADIARAQGNVAAKREMEAKAVEAWMVKEFEERRLRENQFRVEVSASTADPDTYAPGRPDSDDPVMRVSVSVIGEGLIQLRGPIKGLNVIRTMLNQIDAPVGQVRVSVHTLQVNGERGDRMDKVVANIQRYLDHSRFLTAQSSQMLRNAVTSVAARKAAEAAETLAPGWTQWDRDQKYLYAFFGKDFTDELTQLDSEFLKTGNKLLALNSMDSTSLSSALFLMALAKNEVRMEIIQEFLATVQRDLPQAEARYYMIGIATPKHCDACKDKKEYLLASNSPFESLVGFFNAHVTGTDTLNPLQREFIRLAQIFKAQMITEMQLRQRVMERSLLEERVGTNYLDELRKAKQMEDDAKKVLRALQEQLNLASAQSQSSLNGFQVLLEKATTEIGVVSQVFAKEQNQNVVIGQRQYTAPKSMGDKSKGEPRSWQFTSRNLRDLLDQTGDLLNQFYYIDPDAYKRYSDTIKLIKKAATTGELCDEEYSDLKKGLDELLNLLRTEAAAVQKNLDTIRGQLQGDNANPLEAAARYRIFREEVLNRLRQGGEFRTAAEAIFKEADPTFRGLEGTAGQYAAALKSARDARRPLDEKKLLDLLVDEMEDKYVEILEGMRARTANVDNYLKSVTTALDDDFNTQYYLPSFRRAREASRFWDVTLAQIETTSVLTNNRALGKVSPAASYEFDLPKRDIAITEGFRSAKALFDEYGALMNDPSFLALAKLYSGNPVSMVQGGGGDLAAIRSVLPGLTTTPDERIMAQAGPGQKQFGTALDGLIPDPAIYKFETGTGYEIRPVLSPDGQAVVFKFDYLYTTDVREPVRADEKHLGRVKRHLIHTDVQLGNFELREVSKYMVALKVARTGRGVQFLQDLPGVGILFRPLPSASSSLQQNLIYSQATIFPTLFDLMGLRYAPAIADLDPLADRMAEFAARYRRLDVEQRLYDIAATRVDDAVRTPYGERRYDYYRSQMTLPWRHPNGSTGVGLRLHDGILREGYDPTIKFPETQFAPGFSPEGRPKPYNPNTPYGPPAFDPPYTIPQPPPGVPYPGATGVTGPRVPTPVKMPPGSSGTFVPGYGPVGVGKPVPITPTHPTTPSTRPTELPGTSQPPIITTGPPVMSQPPASPQTPLAPVRPIPQPTVPALSPPPTGGK